MTRFLSITLALLGVALVPVARSETAAWITRSNQAAQALLDVQTKYQPEASSALGVESHDADVLDLKPRTVQRQEADLETVVHQYEQALKGETDPRMRTDLEILLKSARDQRTSLQLNDQLMLPYFDLPQLVFSSFQQLLDARVAKSRYPAALVRLKRYAGTAPGYEPITTLARARIQERLADPKMTFPWTVEVEEELKNQDEYLSGIHDLFQKSGLTGWEKDFATLSGQFADEAKWVRATVLPRARTTNLLPPEIYADNLKQFGVDMPPAELMDRAFFCFAQTREEMRALGRVLAKQHGWKSDDPRDVIRELKKDRIPDDKMLEVYRARLASIEQIIREQDLITLPQRAAAIRLASPAESASLPAPHLNIPRLLGNTGEPADFVIPTKNPNADPKAVMDDFNYDAVTWDLTSHEARPGHELQFAAMIEQGVTTARAVFAFNSANVEGWALYSESIMKPYLSPEAQMAVLEARLQRCARAFLDPMLNLGLIKPEAAKRFLIDEVVLSEPLAKEEIDRYTFNAPGQATAYFFGYSKLAALRAKTELALGGKFDAHSYHDFLIAQGLLPPALLEKAVMENYVKTRLAAP